jgi:hypothetical protein
MKLIAHRGNINGIMESLENEPTYIDLAIQKGYDVEVDLWLISDNLYLGHDGPKYKIDFAWLENRNSFLWIHCKNEECLLKLNDSDLNYFWHETDHYTITSKKFIWTYVDIITPQTILNLRKKIDIVDYSQFKGICTDYPSFYLKLLSSNENSTLYR